MVNHLKWEANKDLDFKHEGLGNNQQPISGQTQIIILLIITNSNRNLLENLIISYRIDISAIVASLPIKILINIAINFSFSQILWACYSNVIGAIVIVVLSFSKRRQENQKFMVIKCSIFNIHKKLVSSITHISINLKLLGGEQVKIVTQNFNGLNVSSTS